MSPSWNFWESVRRIPVNRVLSKVDIWSKWMVRGVELDGSKVQKWSCMKVKGPKGLKVGGLRKWTVLRDKTGRCPNVKSGWDVYAGPSNFDHKDRSFYAWLRWTYRWARAILQATATLTFHQYNQPIASLVFWNAEIQVAPWFRFGIPCLWTSSFLWVLEVWASFSFKVS